MSSFFGGGRAAQAIASQLGIARRCRTTRLDSVPADGAALLPGLTREQRDRIPSFAQRWVHIPCRAGALTTEQRAQWEAGARRCYEAQQVDWPDVVVRVPSPVVGALATRVAARVRDWPSTAVIDAVACSTLGPVSAPAISAALGVAVRRVLDACGSEQIQAVLDNPPMPAEVFFEIPSLAKRAYRPVAAGVLAPVLQFGHRFDAAVSTAAGRRVRSAWDQTMGRRALLGQLAFAAFFRDIVEIPVAEHVWESLRAVEAAWSAGHWWVLRHCVVVSDRPTSVRMDDGAICLHWADGWTCTA